MIITKKKTIMKLLINPGSQSKKQMMVRSIESLQYL
jgi:hypothetical protein